MLTKVEVVNPGGETLTLTLGDSSNGYEVENILGLDPVKATIVTSKRARMDGSLYNSSSRENRNVVIELSYVPDYISSTVQSLRDNLYKYFMPKASVLLRFFVDDLHIGDISGRVESLVSPLFAEDPDVQISIICFDPDIVSPIVSSFYGSTVEDATEELFVYPGTIETGFLLSMRVSQLINNFTVRNRLPSGEVMTLDFEYQVRGGDKLEINTQSGEKSAHVIKFNTGGVRIPVLYAIPSTSSWINLYPGENNFQVLVDGTGGSDYDLKYQTRYGGL